MESPQSNLTQIIKQLLSDPRVVDVVTTVLVEMLQGPAHVDENAAAAQTVELSASQPELTDVQQETVAPVSEPIAQPAQESDIRQSQEYIDYSTKTDTQLRALYAYRIKRNIEFTSAFQTILTDRFLTYNPEQKKFTGRGGRRKQNTQPVAQTTNSKKKERIINWDEKPDAILWQAYEHRKHTGIDDKLNATLARRFPDEYDPVARKRIKKVKLHDFTTKRPQESASEQTVTQRRAMPETTPDSPAQLSVRLKLVKQSLNDAYYNVYVNGTKILRNHVNTELKLFADGAVLGIYGIVTTDKHLPERPLWLIYKTDVCKLQWSGNTKFTNHAVYVRSISISDTDLNLILSNGVITQLNIERLKRRAGLTRFEIKR